MAAMQLTRTHRILIGVVVFGAVIIAAIGFAGSYTAVRELAEQKGFGKFSLVFPIGIDAGICVLLALDLLLTWMRIPFPLLRQSAWILTVATIAFNGAAAWPDPLGVGMHAVIPLLFIVTVEAARHAVGRIADITADRHMEGVRLTRWLLSPIPTFKLWRRMKLWELRSYEQVIKLEQDRLIYQSRLQARFGRNWRRKAPIEALMPLRLAKYGVPLADTAASGLAAAGIEPVLLPPAPEPVRAAPVRAAPVRAAPVRDAVADAARPVAELPQAQGEIPTGPAPAAQEQPAAQPTQPTLQKQVQEQEQQQPQQAQQQPQQQPQQTQQQPPQAQQPQPQQPQQPQQDQQQPQQAPQAAPQPGADSAPADPQVSPWFAAPLVQEAPYEGSYNPAYNPAQAGANPDAGTGSETGQVRVPAGPGRSRALGRVPGQGPQPSPQQPPDQQQPYAGPENRQATDRTAGNQTAGHQTAGNQIGGIDGPGSATGSFPIPGQDGFEELPVPNLPDGVTREEAYFSAFRKYISENGDFPNARQFALYLMDLYGITGRNGGPLSENSLRTYLRNFKERYTAEMDSEYIA
ncbi:DUF2637 domain-containing protein [Streptomyces paludis]|uniref:DUF2637 domain-containing protein n=1 Tax=Streptomyces paludis TaxID=2282738 RepID=A0A345HP37_9ACTN|nr:DUF2637 domain-containing protein [Streptomyces paludis]AXG78461.1 DUF2637 domain-containing protein [Streptomyces paludis]